jgi:2-polyprenyl-3-methyl-5-hydroxy-6-metoxy-1,4-benzoquinol methylase
VDIQTIHRDKAKLVEQHGPWISHNIKLADDCYTMRPGYIGKGERAKRYLQTIADIARRPFNDLRILDLACGEGLYAIECALHGADTVGIEGRLQNVAKGEFVKEVLGLDRLKFYQDDVRQFSKEKYGEFDVILCCGILYHLREREAIRLVHRIYEACRAFVILDTQFSVAAKVTVAHDGKTYAGRVYQEHYANKSQAAIAQDVYASLDNMESFWFTVPSLLNLFADAGFSSAHQIANPKAHDFDDRIAILAIRNERQDLLALPELNVLTPDRWEEQSGSNLHRSQRWYGSLVPYAQRIRNMFQR